MEAPSRWEKSLYKTMLHEPRLLMHDSSKNPERYDQEVHNLVSSLVSGTTTDKDLTEQQMDLLDRATAIYLTTPSTMRRKHVPTTQKVAMEKKEQLPEEARELFWWLDQPSTP